MLEIIHLEFEYHDQSLLQGIHFQVPDQGVLHLCGMNGKGKTTLLRLIAGLFHPDAGEIRYRGENIRKDYSAWQQQLCFVAHQSGMHPGLSILENLYFDLQSAHSKAEIKEVMAHAGLLDLSDRLFGTLSAGQQRRVTLLRLCLSRAKVWLLDEPFVALDESTIAWFMRVLQKHREKGGCVLLTSHQPLPAMLDCQEYWL